ncbi:MAG: YjfB family protein [Spirochaetales bacterium]
MIESLSSAYAGMNQAQVMQQAQTSVMKSALDTAEAQGQAVVGLIQESSSAGAASLDPMLGQHVNELA